MGGELQLPLIHILQTNGRSPSDPFGILPGATLGILSLLVTNVDPHLLSPTIGGAPLVATGVSAFWDARVYSFRLQ